MSVVLTAAMRLRSAPLSPQRCLVACVALLSTPAVAATPLCYEKLSGRAGQLDVEQLRLDRDGQQVKGFYRWLPWQKDRRVGRLEGRLVSPGSARVLYRYSQEGQQELAPLTIVFSASQARISWDRTPHAEHGAPPIPPVLLPSRPCAQLQPVPGL